MPQSRPKPSQWLTQQSPKDFLAQENGAQPADTTPQPGQYGPFQPPPNGNQAIANSNAAVDAFTKPNGTPSFDVLKNSAVARGAVSGAAAAGGIPVSPHPVRDFASGLWNNLTAPPSPEEAGVYSVPIVGPPAVAVNRLAGGMGKGAYENAVGGTEEAYTHARNYLESGDPQELEQAMHGATRAGLTVAALFDMAKGPARAVRESASEGAAGVTNAAVGAGKKAIARATDAAADAATKHVEQQTAADWKWEDSHRQKVNQYMHDVAENEQAHAGLTKQITEENAANKAAADERQALSQEIPARHAEIQKAASDLADKTYEQVKGNYPDIGEAKGDAPAIGQEVSAVVKDRLKGSGAMPSEISRIISDYTPEPPPEGEEGGAPAFGEAPNAAPYKTPDARGYIGEPPEGTTPGETPQQATADMLHGQYTELGKAMTKYEGDNLAAVTAARDVIGKHLRDLYKDAGRLPEFNAAQDAYKQYMARFYDKSSPIYKLLNDTTATAAADPARANTGSTPRTGTVERILKNPDNVKTIKRYLKDYDPDGTMTNFLQETADKMARRDSLPKKFTPKQIPVKKEIPVPDLPLRREVGQPPEPFDRKQFIKDKVQAAAENFMRISPWEIAGVPSLIGAATGVLTRSLPAAIESAVGYPVARYAMGRMMENPRFQEWAARERGITPPPQPGAFAPPPAPIRGASGPIEPPPHVPPSSRPLGEVYSRSVNETPVGMGRGGGPGTIGEGLPPQGVITPEEHAALEARVGHKLTPEQARNVRGQIRNSEIFEASKGAAAVDPVKEMREAKANQQANRLDVERGNAQGIISRLGLNIDPSRFTPELRTEILDAFRDFHDKFDRMPTEKQIRSIQEALDLRHFNAYETGTKIRQRLDVPRPPGQ